MLPLEPTVAPVLRPAAVKAAEALGDPRQQTLQRALAGRLGEALQGQVLARLTDGSFVVRVAETQARMLLPPGAQPGMDLPMKLVALQPRPTFQVGAGFAEAGPALPEGADPAAEPLAFHQQGPTALALARAAALLASSAAAGTSAREAGDTAELSAAGKLLGSVLAAAQKDGVPTAGLAGRAPLLPAPGADPAALAGALRQALAGSGLFYEAHVAEWAQGQRTLADLQAEPQMAARPADPLEPGAAGLINLQLATHEQAQVAWHGELWPGQPLRWEVARRDGDGKPAHGGAAEPQQRAWQSRLTLRFGQLGELSASITLSGDQVQVQVEAGHAAAELMRSHTAQLADALDAAGTRLAGLAITDVEAGDGA
jgi:hypothetical protein